MLRNMSAVYFFSGVVVGRKSTVERWKRFEYCLDYFGLFLQSSICTVVAVDYITVKRHKNT